MDSVNAEKASNLTAWGLSQTTPGADHQRGAAAGRQPRERSPDGGLPAEADRKHPCRDGGGASSADGGRAAAHRHLLHRLPGGLHQLLRPGHQHRRAAGAQGRRPAPHAGQLPL